MTPKLPDDWTNYHPLWRNGYLAGFDAAGRELLAEDEATIEAMAVAAHAAFQRGMNPAGYVPWKREKEKGPWLQEQRDVLAALRRLRRG